jgi:hypothetical protein
VSIASSCPAGNAASSVTLPRERLRFLGSPGEEQDVREGAQRVPFAAAVAERAPAGERVVQSSDRWLELRGRVTLARLGLQQISPELERGAVGESQRPLALGGRLGVVREAGEIVAALCSAQKQALRPTPTQPAARPCSPPPRSP